MLSLKSDEVKECVSRLSNNLRAENIEYDSYIELYSGVENINNINNINNTVIYGRRGSGKTHLLKALREKILNTFKVDKNYPVFIDIRRVIPYSSNESSIPEFNAILIFKYLMQELAYHLALNVEFIFGLNKLDSKNTLALTNQKSEINDLFDKLYLEFDGRRFNKIEKITVTDEEVSSLGGSVDISHKPSLKISADKKNKLTSSSSKESHISIFDIVNIIDDVIDFLYLNRITFIIDEWSEVNMDTQLYLAELLKKSFSAIRVTLKIAAIPNRTNLGIKTDQKFVGLEDGGDIIGYPLDMRYVIEVNKTQTRNFFNDLIYKHLYSLRPNTVDKLLKDTKHKKSKIINLFFANVALNEILVACAGIPRDFMNLLVSSYDKFLLTSQSKAKRISVKNVRSANLEWYETDKKEQVDKHPKERELLTKIVQEIIENKKSVHFLVAEKHSNNKHVQNLIDFRVMHLRKNGYSHKDHPGVSYNVYSIDYGCYNSLNIHKNKLDSSVLKDISVKEIRDIRRISLEDNFFKEFLMEIGEAFSCPHCRQPVDINHLAYKKQNLCNNCYESINEIAAEV